MLRNRKIYDKLEEEDILDSAGTLSQHFPQFSCSQTKMSFLLHSKKISRSNRRYPTYFPSSSVNLSLVRIHSRFPVSGRHCDVRSVRRARRRLHPQPRRPHNLRNLHGGQIPRDSQNHLHHDSFLCTFLHPQPSP